MRYSPTVLTPIVQFIASTAGVALIVALVRGLSSLVTDRGPRKRVEAIKTAHETLTALDGVSGAEAVRAHRDREIEALRKSADRRILRQARWIRLTEPFLRHARATTIAANLITVAVLSGMIVLAIRPLHIPAWVSNGGSVVGGAIAVLMFFVERAAQRRLTLTRRAELERFLEQYRSAERE